MFKLSIVSQKVLSFIIFVEKRKNMNNVDQMKIVRSERCNTHILCNLVKCIFPKIIII